MNKTQRTLARTNIVTVFEACGDWKKVARDLGVPKSTAYRWVKEGDRPDQRGGKRFQKINDDHREYMIELIEKKPKNYFIRNGGGNV